MTAAPEAVVIELDGLDVLVRVLRDRGYTVIGPTVRSEAIVLDEITGVADLPRGWTDRQEAGEYRLSRGGDEVFGYAAGPHSPRRYLTPPRRTLWSAERSDDGFVVEPTTDAPPRYAFLGTRACDLAAVAVQDRVHAASKDPDEWYRRVRAEAVFIVVGCTSPSATCFCVSMGTGPRARAGFDLSLVELPPEERGGAGPSFVVEVGSDLGASLLAEVNHRAAETAEVGAVERALESAAASMVRKLDPVGARDVLSSNLEHARWDDVAQRCLSCTNCTLVCPTCFCHTTEDVTDLTGDRAERQWRWSSCFELDHSYLHGGSVHDTIKTRYRQWLVHKLSTWWDQFDESGCVGCGRCITWCPVGIDLTAEVAAMAAGAAADVSAERRGTP